MSLICVVRSLPGLYRFTRLRGKVDVEVRTLTKWWALRNNGPRHRLARNSLYEVWEYL